jgi:hypothetical protein
MTMGSGPKCHFVLVHKSVNLKISKVGILAILGAHNFVCKRSIKIRSKKVMVLVERFSTVCYTPPTRKEIRVICDF